MSLAVGSNAAAAAGYAGSSYGAAGGATKSAAATDNADTASSSSSASTNVTLSDEAKAYLAQMAAATDDAPSISTVTANARAWFDQQYASLGISSALLDGQVAVDFS